MSGKAFLRLLPLLAMLSFKGYAPGTSSPREAIALYAEGDRLFNLATTETDQAALGAFSKLVGVLAHTVPFPSRNELFYQAYYKQGVLHEVYGRFGEATHAYVAALRFAADEEQRLKIDVFAGAGYYKMNNFDSANFYLLQAEQNAGGLSTDQDRVRLFNTLGVLYYDNGNYLQAKNYLSQALAITDKKNPLDAVAPLSVKLNIASCYYRLGLFDQALAIYLPAASGKLLRNQIFISMGKAYVGAHRYPEALKAFRKVDARVLPGVWNDMAGAALASGQRDSAVAWLLNFQLAGGQGNPQDNGINCLYEGDLRMAGGDAQSAILSYHRALVAFSGNFKNGSIRSNPASFNGSFAFYRLFEALSRKAQAWEAQYEKTKRIADLESAYDSYSSTLSLLNYIERSFEMDDAKVLLKQNSGAVYERAFRLCLRLDTLNPGGKYLEEAFRISERRKASVVAAHLQEQHFQSGSLQEAILLHQERNIRFNLSRLSGQLEEKSTDGIAAGRISAEKISFENQLVAVQRQLKKSSRYFQIKYEEDYPTVAELRRRLNRAQALISFTVSDSGLHAFVLTRERFARVDLGGRDGVREAIAAYVHTLQSAGNGIHADTRRWDTLLYKDLVAPLEKAAGDKPEWKIVPDGYFFSLPFEALPDGDGGRLLAKHAVSYLISSRFVESEKPGTIEPARPDAVLAFAPFCAGGADLHQEGLGNLAQLPASRNEIAGLPGQTFFDAQATKGAFLRHFNRYPVIHLATHAVADLTDPQASYIAFYPAAGMRAEDNLFLGELNGLHMDSCRLVIMSACETGKGRLVSQEGVMSFARAFLYAGCPSTVNSLWKADDKSTAAILTAFHAYLQKGASKAVALQQAKLDFIREHPLARDPAYWSNLVLNGNADPLYKKKPPLGWVVGGAVLIAGIIVIFLVRRSSGRRKRSSPPADNKDDTDLL